CRLEIDERVACKQTVFGSLNYTLLNRTDVFAWYNTTDDFIDEFKTCTFFIRFKLNIYVTILTTSTRLADKFTFSLCGTADRFTICNLWSTNVCFHFEFSFQTVNDNIQVKFTHSRNNRLACFSICFSFECRVLFG